MTETDLITRLGGAKYVSERTGASKTAVCNWRHNGIPWRLRTGIAALANELGVELPDDFLPSLADTNNVKGPKAA